MLKETELCFAHVMNEDRSLLEFIDADYTFLNERLATHYDIPGVKGIAMRRVQLPPDSPRGGFMTQASVLKVTANGTTTSPVLRGKWIMERILGYEIPPPPPVAAVSFTGAKSPSAGWPHHDHRPAKKCRSFHRREI